jgi:4-carboxymuconolactone decarboxylase
MRIPRLTPETMSAEQRAVYDRVVSGPRGALHGPLLAALFKPELADKWQQFGEILRFRNTLPRKLSELAILVTARHWTSQFEWLIHARDGLKAGLSQATLDAIRDSKIPVFADPLEKLVFDFATEIHETHSVSQATYDAALKAFDVVGVVDLTAVIGYYTLVSMTLNVHDIYSSDEPKPLPEKRR